MIQGVAILSAVGAVSWASLPAAHPVTNAEEACVVAKARVVARDRLPESAIAFCDPIPAGDGPRGYYILALHSGRQCDGICSTNMGWFAVRKSTGGVFEWNVGEWKPGQPVSDR